MYKFWYVIGLIFMGIFFISAKQYENKKGAK